MADLVEEIKAKLDIVTVVSQYVQLKKAGQNYKGLCPFHNEKTPSFVVSPEKQIFHCFGCHKGGDLFTFIEEIEGVSFAEALQVLADKAGIKVKDLSKYDKKTKSEKDQYYKAHDLACEFFEKALWKSNDGKKVLEYLHKRGLDDATIKDFRIGFAPDEYEALYPMLLKRGIDKKVLIKSGFVSSKGIADDKVYDKFRGRLMFPILDYMGKVCGFGGRALKKDQAPKYLNSPENIIYNKSKVLYGLYHAKQDIKEQDKIVLVEGYFDVILPFQAGVRNIVATSGTALTEDQIRLIKRLTTNAVMAFDSDSAGFEASRRGYFLMEKAEFSVKMVNGLDKKDPADYVLDHGDEFGDLVQQAEDFVAFYINKLVVENDMETLDGRKIVLKEILPILKSVSASVRDYYVRILSKKINVSEKALYDDIDRFNLPKDHPAQQNQQKTGFRISAEEILMAILLEFPEKYKKFAEKLNEMDFSQELKAIYKALTDQYNRSRTNFETWDFDRDFLAEQRSKIDVFRVYAEDKYAQLPKEILDEELRILIDKVKNDRKIKQLNDIRKDLEDAEESGNKEKRDELLKKQIELLKN